MSVVNKGSNVIHEIASWIPPAIIFGLAVARPGAVSRAVIILSACIPAGTAFFQYLFIGTLVPGHMLLLAAVAAFFGAFGAKEASSEWPVAGDGGWAARQ